VHPSNNIMSEWTEGWDDDVEFDDDDEDEAIDVYHGQQDEKEQRTQSMSLGNGMFMGRLTNLISKVADEGQMNTDEDSVGEEPNPKSSLASRITSMIAPSLVVDGGDGWDDDDINDISGWGEDENLDDIEIEEVECKVDRTSEPTISTPVVNAPVQSRPQHEDAQSNETNERCESLQKNTPQHDPQKEAEDVTGWKAEDDVLLNAEDDDTVLAMAAHGQVLPPNSMPHAAEDNSGNEQEPEERFDSMKAVDQYEENKDVKAVAVSTPSITKKISSGHTSNNGDERELGWDNDDGLDDLDISISTQEASNANEEVKQIVEDEKQAEDGWEQDEVDLEQSDQLNEPEITDDEQSGNNNGIDNNIEHQGDDQLDNPDAASSQRSVLQEQISSPLVDQVPNNEAPPVPLRDSTIVMGSERSTTLDEETLDEQYFGPVVDHLPPPDRLAPERALSIATQARYEDLDQDSKEVGEDTEPGQTSEENMNRAPVAPSVVDHVPTIHERTRSFIKDSNFAIASQQSSTVMEDIWREDFDPNDEDYGPVVDQLPPTQTPTPSIRSLRSISSLAVQGAIVEEDDDTKEDASEKRRFGIFSGASVADSIAVVAPIAEHEDEENTVGQTVDGTIDGTTDGVDDETVSNAFPALDATAQSEPLVDHVPLRRENRPVDAPTSVIADQLEFSTVGDLTYEEVQYGPVVDHTPPPDPSWQASAAASVIVAATKSECPDDFEDDIDGETYAMGTGDDGATVETSLCDHNSTDENLVDHVPETPGLRRVNSSSAIAEAQSVISTRDDEFGLVVDHTPIPPIGSAPGPRDSVGALATLSEGGTLQSDEVKSLPGSCAGRAVEVDKVPAPLKINKADSTYTNKSHGENEDSNTLDETLEVDEYGPVVDHLPPGSTVLSRGGSTTGGLATLSEANFDGGTTDAEGDGWDEDDIEVNDMETSVEEEFREDTDTPETRNKSVTFQNLEGAPTLPSISGSTNGGRNLPQPYSVQFNTVDFGETSALNYNSKEWNSPVPSDLAKCRACNDESLFECPCIQRLLAIPGDENAAISSRVTAHGTPLSIDFSKLLQDEVTKRLTLEKEIEKYKAQVASFGLPSTMETNQQDNHQEELERLLKSNMDLSNRLTCQRDEFASQLESSKAEKIEMIGEVKKVKETLSGLKSHNESLTLSEGELKAELLDLKNSQQQQKEASYHEMQGMQDQLKNTSEELNKVHCTENLKDERASMEKKLIAANENMLNSTKIVSDLKDKEQGYKQEIERLQEIISDSTSMPEVEIHLNEKFVSLEKELHSKCKEFEVLQDTVRANKVELEQSREFQIKHGALERKISQLEEKVRLTENEHKEEIESYITKINEVETELNDARAEIDTISKVKLEVESRCKGLEEIAREKDALSVKLRFLEDKNRDLLDEQRRQEETNSKLISDSEKARKSHEESASIHSRDFEKLKNEVVALNALKKEHDDMVLNTSAMESQLASQVEAVQLYEAETFSLKQQLEQANCEVKALRKGSDEGSTYRAMVDALKVKLADQAELSQTKNQELINLRLTLDSVTAEAEQLKLERDEILRKRDLLQVTISELKQDKNETKESMESQMRLNTEKLQATLQQLDSMSHIDSELRSDLDILTKEKDSLLLKNAEMESDGEEMLVQLGLHKEELDVREREIADLRERLASIENVNELATNKLRTAEGQIRRLEDSNFEEKEDQIEQIDQYKEQLDGKDRELNVLRDALRASETSNVKITDNLRNAEERIRRLEQESVKMKEPEQETEGYSDAGTKNLLQSLDQFTVENSSLKHQVDDLASAKIFQEEELKAKNSENEGLRKQLDELESATAANTVEKKDKEAFFAGMEKDLKQQIIQLDSSRISQQNEIERLQTEHASREELLRSTREKLSNAEEALLRMELDVDFEAEESSSKDYHENMLAEAKETIRSHEKSLELAKSKSVALTMDLSAVMKELQVEKENNRKVRDSEEGKKTANRDQQLSTLLVELTTTKNLLTCKEQELERVSLDLEECRAEELEATQKVATRVLESEMSKEEAETSENMRNLIISLSQALEKSETQRADGIERLLRERKTNADSLRKLGESVKRFYVSLNATSPQR